MNIEECTDIEVLEAEEGYLCAVVMYYGPHTPEMRLLERVRSRLEELHEGEE